MANPIALCVGQFSDMPLEEICKFAQGIGFDGLELSFRTSIINMPVAAKDTGYCGEIMGLLAKYGLKSWTVSAHMFGQCVGDYGDPRLNNLCPEQYRNKPDEIRKWATDQMMLAAPAAKNLGIPVVSGFMGSTLWRYFYFYPQVTRQLIDDAYGEFLELWNPILDNFKKNDVKFALEVHPTEIAYDYYTTDELLRRLNYHPAFGINYDPSHLVWQGIDPVLYLRDFAKNILNTHMKDVYVKMDGRNGILGSHMFFGDPRRAWNFRSIGHGSVNFDDIIREINHIGFTGPLAVEWEDNGMEKKFGAQDAFEYIKRLNYSASKISFDTVTINKDKK
ncbi:AP endonuclease [Spirochaetia bacterium]|nr:AP endonuclease [Spirochaetia bacterium]